MITDRWKKVISIGLVLAFLVVVGLALSFALEYYRYRYDITFKTQQQLVDLTKNAASSIDLLLRDAVIATDSLAQDISNGRLNQKEVDQRSRELIAANGLFYGVCVAYKPYAFSPDARLYARYWVRKQDSIDTIRLESMYDYTEPEHAWFNTPLKGAAWVEPYFGQASDTLITAYGAPFYMNGHAGDPEYILGVVVITISLDKIRDLIKSLDLGPSGFPALVSKKGIYIYHPSTDYVLLQKSIFDVAHETDDYDRLRMGKDALLGKSGLIKHKSVTTGLESWLVYEPVSLTGWSLQNTFINDDIPLDIDKIRRGLIGFVCCSVFAIVCALSFFAIRTSNVRILWAIAAINTILMAVAIIIIWDVALNWGQCIKGNGFNVLNRHSVSNFIQALNSEKQHKHEALPVYIPAGVVIKSIEFHDSNKVKIDGFTWQRYDKKQLNDISPGVSLTNGIDIKMHEVVRYTDNSKTVVGWNFYGDFYQNLDYSTYPVDCMRLTLGMQHADRVHNIILVPDVDAYDVLNPSTLPGIKRDFMLSGWNLEKSFFTMKQVVAHTNLGLEIGRGDQKDYDMDFNIIITRRVFNAFVQNMTPLIVVALLIFLVLTSLTNDMDRAKRMDLKPGAALRLLGSMFLVVVFVHINLRSRLFVDSIFYLEYFYFITYLTLFATSINFVLFAVKTPFLFIHREDGLLTKLMYFPNMLAVLLIITALIFY
jgi:hypothetical protein